MVVRPKDEDGHLLDPPHKRLENAVALEQRAVFALAQDRRLYALTLGRKLTLIRKAIDHIVDGDKAPKWVFAKDKDDPENRALADGWHVACREVKAGLGQ